MEAALIVIAIVLALAGLGALVYELWSGGNAARQTAKAEAATIDTAAAQNAKDVETLQKQLDASAAARAADAAATAAKNAPLQAAIDAIESRKATDADIDALAKSRLPE